MVVFPLSCQFFLGKKSALSKRSLGVGRTGVPQIIPWEPQDLCIASPRIPVTNEGLVGNSLLKMVHHPGDDDCIVGRLLVVPMYCNDIPW